VATIDHVTVRASDLDASLALFARSFDLLGFGGERFDNDVRFHEWNDFSIAMAKDDRPPTRNLHVGFVASSPTQVDNWWRVLTAAGYRNDGEPGSRPEYSASYYGAFIRDRDENSIEAVVRERQGPAAGTIDHLWIRVRDLATTRRFYEAVAPVLGLEVRERPDRLALFAESGTFSFVQGTPTENLHLAIGVSGNETVRAFHAAGLEAGGVDNGAPGERPEYHAGYHGAYICDPDANNIEAVFHNR
jgi:catechol 2,3-dioxygenase-like lactoylglutathione lyase family enzyme